MVVFPIPARPLSQKNRSAFGSWSVIHSRISFRIASLVPSKQLEGRSGRSLSNRAYLAVGSFSRYWLLRTWRTRWETWQRRTASETRDATYITSLVSDAKKVPSLTHVELLHCPVKLISTFLKRRGVRLRQKSGSQLVAHALRIEERMHIRDLVQYIFQTPQSRRNVS